MPNGKVSVIIPSNKELFLPQTIADVFAKATGDVEVIPVLDGYWPDPPIEERPNLRILHRGESQGMRAAINSAAAIATGEYLCKCDAHCLFAEGFDEILKAECDDNWVVIPRRYSLDAEKWAILETGKSPVDYHYLSWAYAKPEEIGIHGAPWNERARERKDILLDDEMSSQGSCWFMTKRHFTECLGGLSEVGYETFVQEFQEIGLKTWLGGGAVKINKKTWYAHLHKGKQYGRGYFISKGTMLRGTLYSADFWMNNRWPERKHNLEWLIEKFWPVPTWPANRAEWRTSNGTDITEPAARIVVPAPPPPPAPSVIAATPPAPAPKPTAVRVEGQQSDTIEAIFRIFHLTPDPLKRMPIEIPNAGRDRLAVLFAELGFTKGAEIGVEQGAYSEVLCKANPGLKVLYCVDAWQHYAGYRDHVNQQKLDGFYIATKARLAPYPAVLMRAFSLDAIKVFEPNGLDFCYIDAAHDLVSVINDLAAWSKLVRPGGIIAGHDYCRTKNDFQLHVVDAVNAFTNAYRISPWFLLGTKEERPGEIRDKRRSFLWVKR